MTIAHRFKKLALNYGIELRRYNPAQSQDARIARLIAHHGIDLILDVGANTGGFGSYMREIGFQGEILSFEPLEQAHTELTRVALSDERWHVAPRMALGSEDGTIEINVAGNSVSSSILPMHDAHAKAAPSSRYIGKQLVPLKRLDSISHPALMTNRKILLKIDTQGFEMSVLQGAAGLLPYVHGIQLELSLIPLYQGQPLYREIIEWLADQGFELWNVMPGFLDESNGRLLQFDGIFFRSADSKILGNP